MSERNIGKSSGYTTKARVEGSGLTPPRKSQRTNGISSDSELEDRRSDMSVKERRRRKSHTSNDDRGDVHKHKSQSSRDTNSNVNVSNAQLENMFDTVVNRALEKIMFHGKNGYLEF